MPEDRDEARKEPKTAGEVSRRDVLRLGAIAGAAVPLGGLIGGAAVAAADQRSELPQLSEKAIQLEEATIAQLQAAMARGGLTSASLVDMYLERIAAIDESGPTVNSVLQLNPDARKIAKQLDHERKTKGPRGPLHGIPVMLKGNIDTGDRMQTTAGSLALIGTPAHQDATVAARLRAAGAVILGKTNLSEWANFRGFNSTSGWSGQGGLTRNPYVLDRNTSGSSSGSAASVAANLVAAGLGTETDGSIISPANNNGVAAIKPTVGLTSRAGVVPISHTQDTVGPHARTVADAAAILSALVGVDPRDPQTAASAGKFSTDYTQFLDPHALQGARVGVLRTFYTGYSAKTDALFELALTAIHGAGATLVDPADLPTINDLLADDSETIVLFYEFKRDLNNYLATRTGVPIHTLTDAIAFNNAHAAQELQFFGQEEFLLSESDPFTAQQYQDALVRGHMLAGAQGIDAALANDNLDVLVAPSGSPAWTTDLINGDHFGGGSTYPSAVAGYPIVNVPMGLVDGFLPVGLSFIGTAYSEQKLIGYAYAYEQATKLRRRPTFLPSTPFPNGQPDSGPGGTATTAVLPARLEALMDRLQVSPRFRDILRNL